jgi:hypothetical protein
VSGGPAADALNDAELRAIVERVFRDRSSSLQAEGERVGSARLCGSIMTLRVEMIGVVAGISDFGFTPIEDPPPGEAGWTAGQIVSHNAERLLWALLHADATLGGGNVGGVPPELAAGAAEPPLPLERDRALDVLAAADRYLDAALPNLIAADDGRVAAGTHHGEMGLPGWLLLIAIHDHDHLGQLMVRADQSRAQ